MGVMNKSDEGFRKLLLVCFCIAGALELVAAVITKSNHGSARALWIVLLILDLTLAGLLAAGKEELALLGSYTVINLIMIIPFYLITKRMFDPGNVFGALLFVLGIIVGLALAVAAFLHFFSSVRLETVIKCLNVVSTGTIALLAAYAVFAINYRWWRFYIHKFISNGYLIGGAAFVLTLVIILVMTFRYIGKTKPVLNVEVIDKAASVVETVENKLSESKAVQVAVNAAENAIESATDILKTEEPKDTEKNVETAVEEVETAVEEETEKPQKVERMGKVRAISGPVEGEAFKLPQKNEIIIGSDPSQSHWIIKDKSVSRKHCSLRYQALENIYIVTDFSTNGTFADGERLEKGVPTPLMSGAELTFARGETKIKLG